MAIPNNKKELISHSVIKVLYSRFKSFRQTMNKIEMHHFM